MPVYFFILSGCLLSNSTEQLSAHTEQSLQGKKIGKVQSDVHECFDGSRIGFAQETFNGTNKSLDEWIASTEITAV